MQEGAVMLRQGKPEEGFVGICVAAAEPQLAEKGFPDGESYMTA